MQKFKCQMKSECLNDKILSLFFGQSVAGKNIYCLFMDIWILSLFWYLSLSTDFYRHLFGFGSARLGEWDSPGFL